MRREWRGSVFKPADKRHLYLKIKVDGAWRREATPFLPGQEKEAEAALAEIRERLLAQESAMGGAPGPVTVRTWSKRWLETRGSSRPDDESILRLHILPAIGDRLVAEVTTRVVLEMVRSWDYSPDDPAAPGARTIGNWYSVARSLFRDAAVEGLIPATPCTLTAPHIPLREDKDSEWRATAVFKRDELALLLTPNPEIEEDSRVTYTLLALGALRHGELAALRWRHYDTDRDPLGALLIANSNRKRRTKKNRTRWMPVHPALAAVLAEWKLTGWPRFMGRAPGPDDLVLPLPAALARGRRPRLVEGDVRMRTKDFTWKRLDRHLDALKLRHRRVHDWRRTFLSLAEADGADRTILGWGTHGRAGDILSAYTEPDWRRLCAEVLKLQVGTARRGRVLPMGTKLGAARGHKGSR